MGRWGRWLCSANGHRQANRAPEVENAENHTDHDDVPGTVTQGPGRQKQLGDAMEGSSHRHMLKHQKPMGEEEQSAGDAAHQHFPRPAQSFQQKGIQALGASTLSRALHRVNRIRGQTSAATWSG